MPKQDYIVLKASQRKTTGVDVDNRHNDFGKKSNSFVVNDAGLAREIEARYGNKGEALPGEVVVAPLNRAPDPIHKRTFTVPDLPWLHKKESTDGTDRENGEALGADQAAGGDCNAPQSE